MDRIGSDWIGSDRTGSDRIGLDPFIHRVMDTMRLPGISRWGATRHVQRLKRVTYEAPGISKMTGRERPNTEKSYRSVSTRRFYCKISVAQRGQCASKESRIQIRMRTGYWLGAFRRKS